MLQCLSVSQSLQKRQGVLMCLVMPGNVPTLEKDRKISVAGRPRAVGPASSVPGNLPHSLFHILCILTDHPQLLSSSLSFLAGIQGAAACFQLQLACLVRSLGSFPWLQCICCPMVCVLYTSSFTVLVSILPSPSPARSDSSYTDTHMQP